MKTAIRGTVVLLFLFLTVSGCSQKSSEQSAGATSGRAQAQPTQPTQPAQPTESSQPTQAAAPAETPAQPNSPQASSQRSTPAAAQPSQEAEPVPTAAPEPAAPAPEVAKAEPPRSPEPNASKPTAPVKPAAASAPQAAPKDVVILKGAPMGGVRFEHKLHTERAGNKCETCHHPSRPEKPAMVPQQACSNCHTKVATPPMRTKYQGAFHNPVAQSGTCIDCHKAENGKGKHAPVKCLDCHKKENT